MTARSHSRGHEIEYNSGWIYSDTKQPINDERPCIRCGQLPTVEGHDACLGFLPGVESACCGHGITEMIIMEDT